MAENPIRVVIASGATGGHVYPCIVVAEAIRDLQPDARFLFIGASGKIDEEIIEQHGFEFASIKVSGFSRGLSFGSSLRTAAAVARLVTLRPLFEALGHLRRFRPHVVFGAGGYVSGPVIAAAWLKRVPRAILEANAVPGLTNRMVGRLSNAIFVSFEPAARRFGRCQNVIVAGNPIRQGDETKGQKIRADLGFDRDRLLIAVVGGSLGSGLLNNTTLRLLPILSDHDALASRIQVLHCVGKRFWEEFRQKSLGLAERLGFKYIPVPFVTDLHNLLYATDVAICRGGAITLSEIASAGVAPIVVPWEGAANNEQLANARFLEQRGAAIVVEEKDLDEERLCGKLVDLVVEDGKRNKVRANCKRLAKPDAAKVIGSVLVGLGQQGPVGF